MDMDVEWFCEKNIAIKIYSCINVCMKYMNKEGETNEINNDINTLETNYELMEQYNECQN